MQYVNYDIEHMTTGDASLTNWLVSSHPATCTILTNEFSKLYNNFNAFCRLYGFIMQNISTYNL